MELKHLYLKNWEMLLIQFKNEKWYIFNNILVISYTVNEKLDKKPSVKESQNKQFFKILLNEWI